MRSGSTRHRSHHVKYACLIGVDGAGLPRVADMPFVCNVTTVVRFVRPRSQPTTLPQLHHRRLLGRRATRSPDPDRHLQHDHPDRQRHPAVHLRACRRGQQRQLGRALVRGLLRPVRDRCRSRRSTPSLLLDRTGQHGRLQLGRQPARWRLRPSSRPSTPPCSAIALGFTGPTSLFRMKRRATTATGASSQPINACTHGGAYTHTVKAISLDPGAHLDGPDPHLRGHVARVANANGGDELDRDHQDLPPQRRRLPVRRRSPSTTATTSTSRRPSGWTLLERTRRRRRPRRRDLLEVRHRRRTRPRATGPGTCPTARAPPASSSAMAASIRQIRSTMPTKTPAGRRSGTGP